ncbi:hypothetical protein E2C01_037901 [Portunus trituberculatus]|uniref:Uncharacterized protein n=1 Tax=Portunus trituberculatus TaxID=210409 RepID=A0A5B7FIF7_PORTR|nr:hypothetical protein [Portunus trituberculatus]
MALCLMTGRLSFLLVRELSIISQRV